MTPPDPETERYFVLLDESLETDAVITALPGGPEPYEYAYGLPLRDRFPRDATIRFSDDYEGRKLLDFQPNTLSVPIVSPRARAIIEACGVTNAEFLPVTVLDHRGDVAALGYSIVNLLGAEDGIDFQRSQVVMNPLDRDEVFRVKRLVLRRAGIADTARMFRLARLPWTTFIRDDLLAAFQGAGLTGYKVRAAEGWNGLPL